jgi:DnaJ-class molecular chaperone
MKISLKLAFALASILGLVGAFQGSQWPNSRSTRRRANVSQRYVASTDNAQNRKNQDDSHFLLKKFSTASGEILNPYQVLQVSRNADRKEVRAAYIKLSKRYHPDGVRHRDILPGSW